MNAWRQLFNRSLTESECDKIISLGLSRPAIQGTIGHGDASAVNTQFWKKAMPFDRKISMVIQLSKPEQYEGGRLELANDPLPADKFVNQGDIIFFPAFNRHRVLPVTRGIRYSLVTWFVGPKFK